MQRPVDPDEHLVQMPLVTRAGPPSALLVGVGRPNWAYYRLIVS
jgi:hypothetical protein